VLSIVAVHGLGGHALSTWTHESAKTLWLRDFLPKDIPNARIMTYGYDSKVWNSRSVVGIMENAEGFLMDLQWSRASAEVRLRPIRND
jgi:hypothetical protein